MYVLFFLPFFSEQLILLEYYAAQTGKYSRMFLRAVKILVPRPKGS